MEFLGKLGIDINLLIAQIINFGLLLWLLKKFLYIPIIRRIEKDERELDEAKILKKKLKEEKRLFQIQKAKELADAREKAENIISEAESIAEKVWKEAREESEKEKEKVIKQIRARLKDIEYE